MTTLPATPLSPAIRPRVGGMVAESVFARRSCVTHCAMGGNRCSWRSCSRSC